MRRRQKSKRVLASKMAINRHNQNGYYFGGRKKKQHKRRLGGALSDYVPSLSTVAGYVPGATTALGYYNKGQEIYNTGKRAYNAYEQYKPVIDNVLDTISPVQNMGPQNVPLPPPLPPGGLPPLSKKDQEHNRKLQSEIYKKNPFLIPPPKAAQDIKLDGFKLNPMLESTPVGKFHKYASKYKPISFIDNTLKSIGQRDRVRKYLTDKGLGKLVSLADEGIKMGYGRRHRRRKMRRRF